MSTTRINRRAVLRGALAGGALVTIPLPRLGAMFNGNGNAYAAGGAIQRFGIFFAGNGVVPALWVPTPRVTGPLGVLPEQLAPFEPVKSKITVVSGFDLATGRTNGVPHGHFVGALSGAAATSNRVYQLPSIDQVIAKASLGKTTPHKSLEVGVSKASPNVSQAMYHAVSQGGPNTPNYPEYMPSNVFQAFFAGGVGAAPSQDAGVDPTSVAEKSVLDAVMDDVANLGPRLGAEDRARLDQHLDSLRALELRVGRTSGGGANATCAMPKSPMDGNVSNDGLDATLADTMSDLVVMALACDLTRVFSYMLTMPAAHVAYPSSLAVGGDFHGTCHGESPDEQPKVQKGVAYAMGFFSSLLQKLDAIKEGSATMLDNSTVMFSTCVAWGKTHTQYEWPCVIGGRGGVRADGSFNMKGGWHYRADSSDNNFSKVLLTLANMHGSNLTEIGKDGGHVTDEVAGIRG
jgi:Protein of unknown function (DUF1552)